MRRYLFEQLDADLGRKMVFLGGPRQVGKTTLARDLLPDAAGYLNWDVPEHREAILRRELPAAPRLVFDEFHKHRTWRNYLKGLYDRPGERPEVLVTGSARLDYYRFGGDSLQGRYNHLRLHPLSLAELGDPGAFEPLLQLGGFPEPFLEGSDVEATRWSRAYRDRLVREEITSLERIQDLGRLELLLLRLPDLVGSPLSINALREDLQLGHKTVARWLEVFERLYAVFRLAPFGAPKLRAIKKARKHYHFDWSVVPELPARFENMVASHLLKWVHYVADTQGRDVELRYFRDVDRREVDFVVTEDGKPLQFIECKWSEGRPDRSLRYLVARFPDVDAWQVSATGTRDAVSAEGIRLAPAWRFMQTLV